MRTVSLSASAATFPDVSATGYVISLVIKSGKARRAPAARIIGLTATRNRSSLTAALEGRHPRAVSPQPSGPPMKRK